MLWPGIVFTKNRMVNNRGCHNENGNLELLTAHSESDGIASEVVLMTFEVSIAVSAMLAISF